MVRNQTRDQVLEGGIRKIDRLMKQDKVFEALAFAVELQDDYPSNYRLHLKLAEVAIEAGDTYIVASEYEVLIQMSDNPLALIDKAIPYFLDNGMFATALVYLNHPLCTSPSYIKLSNDVSSMLEQQPMLAKVDLPDYTALAESELIRSALDFAELIIALNFSKDAIKNFPKSVTVRCAHARVLLHNGLMDEAIREYNEALKIAPDALLPLASLVRAHIFNGDMETARAVAERIREHYLDKDIGTCLQTLGLCADYPAVLDAYAKASIGDIPGIVTATVHHIVAVAYQRIGDRVAAEKFWRKAIKASPDVPYAGECLADHNRPPDMRNGSWVSGSAVEMPRIITQTLVELLDDDSDIDQTMPQLLAAQPWMKRCIGWMMTEGDEQMVRIGFGTALSIPIEEAKGALVQFAFGKHGCDELRIGAYTYLVKMNQIPPGAHSLWVKGKLVPKADFNDLFVVDDYDDFDIADAALPDPLMEQIEDLIDARDFNAARVLIHDLIEAESDNFQARMLLSQVELLTGNVEAAQQTLLDLYADYPNEPTVATSVVHMYAATGKLREARTVLNQVEQKLLNGCDEEEYAAFCEVSVLLNIEEGHVDATKFWLNELEAVDPNSSFLAEIHKKFEQLKRSKANKVNLTNSRPKMKPKRR